MTTFKPSIIDYSSIRDCKMILDELKIDLLPIINNKEQKDLLNLLLDSKIEEVNSRYWKNI